MRKQSPGNVQHPVGKSLTYGGCRETTLLFTEVNPIEQTANWGLGLMTLSQAEVVPCFSYSLSDITGTTANHFPKKGSILTVLRSNYSF